MDRINLLTVYRDLDLELFITLKDELVTMERELAEEDLASLPQLYGNYAALAAIAKKEAIRSEDDFEVWKGKIRSGGREFYASKGVKTSGMEAALKDYVSSHEEYPKYREVCRNSMLKWDYLKALVRCVDMRKDGLIQIASTIRAEAKIYS